MFLDLRFGDRLRYHNFFNNPGQNICLENTEDREGIAAQLHNTSVGYQCHTVTNFIITIANLDFFKRQSK